jgi:hypothetical protein
MGEMLLLAVRLLVRKVVVDFLAALQWSRGVGLPIHDQDHCR